MTFEIVGKLGLPVLTGPSRGSICQGPCRATVATSLWLVRVALVVREVPRQQLHAHAAFDQAAPNVWALPCLRQTHTLAKPMAAYQGIVKNL